MIKKLDKGFTLVELLVVISIIGLLSSVVFASLSSAKNKAKDALIKSSMDELVKLAELEFSDNGSYANMQPSSWISVGATCSAFVGGNYKTQANNICTKITQTGTVGIKNLGTNYQFWAGNYYSNSTQYSFMAGLTDGSYYCVGISGKSTTQAFTGSWSGIGCHNNP